MPDIRQLAICRHLGDSVAPESRILDFGCGAGRRVYELFDSGYQNCYGFDVKDYLNLKVPSDASRFKIAADGALPFPDEYFDCIISDQVFEHVADQSSAFGEIHRALRKGGVSVHVFPSRWQFIEPHIFVPFGGLIKAYGYYLFWAWLGIRNSFQKGLSAREVAQKNLEYARTCLNYRSGRDYDRLCTVTRFQHSWRELEYMALSTKPLVRSAARIARWVPFAGLLIRTFWVRVLYLRKPA